MTTPDWPSPPPPPMPDFGAAGLIGTRVLGVGAASVVYEGRDGSGACFAIKVPRRVDDQAVAALHHEAEVIQRLRDHAGDAAGATDAPDATDATGRATPITLITLVKVISLGDIEALVLHPCAAHNLRKSAPLHNPETALAVLHELATALEMIHDAGIVHADLSPANIVMHEGRPVIVDFAGASLDGVARPVIHGTLPYAAPEVLRGDPPTARSDLYSLGRIACELLTGRADPDEKQLSEATLSIDAGDELDALRAIILASVSAKPNERPRSAGRWRDALDSCAAITKPFPVPLSDGDPIDRRGPIDVRGAIDLSTIDLRGPIDRHGAPPATEAHATREFGRRPPPATPEAIAPRPWLMPAFAATAAVIVVVAAVLGLRALVGPAGPSGRTGPTDQVLTASAKATAAATPAPSAAPSEVVEWNPERAEATLTRATGSRRYQIGAPGDQLLAGRWSCRGAATPVLYRPSTGDLYEFSGWAESNAPTPSARVQHLDLREGRLQLDRDGDCDRVSIAVGDRRVPVRLTTQAEPR